MYFKLRDQLEKQYCEFDFPGKRSLNIYTVLRNANVFYEMSELTIDSCTLSTHILYHSCECKKRSM